MALVVYVRIGVDGPKLADVSLIMGEITCVDSGAEVVTANRFVFIGHQPIRVGDIRDKRSSASKYHQQKSYEGL